MQNCNQESQEAMKTSSLESSNGFISEGSADSGASLSDTEEDRNSNFAFAIYKEDIWSPLSSSNFLSRYPDESNCRNRKPIVCSVRGMGIKCVEHVLEQLDKNPMSDGKLIAALKAEKERYLEWELEHLENLQCYRKKKH